MVKYAVYRWFLPLACLLLVTLACGRQVSRSEPTAPVAPITLQADLTAIDLCQAIPVEDIEAVMGRKLASDPQFFEYYDTTGSSGCAYSASKSSDGEAFFGYVVLTPIEAYNNQPLYLDEDVFDIGQEAYFNNGADARQLWVKINDQVAMVVAFGDVAIEDGCKALAELVLAAIK